MITLLQQLGKNIAKFFAPEESTEYIDLKLINAFLGETSKHTFSKFLPYIAYDPDNQLFVNKSSTGFVIEAEPILGTSEDVETQLTSLFQHILPPGSNIQFLLLASPKVSPLLSTWQNLRQGSSDLVKTLAKKRVNFLRQRAVLPTDPDRSITVRNFRLFISYSLANANLSENKQDEMVFLREQIMTLLKDTGISNNLLSIDNFINTIYDLINTNDSLIPSEHIYDQYEPINKQLVDYNTFLKMFAKHMQISTTNSKQNVHIVRPQKRPSNWGLSEMGEFIGSFFNEQRKIVVPFLVHYGVHICDDPLLKSKMMTKCSNAERSANSPIAKWIPSIREEAAEWGYVRASVEKDHRFVKTSMAVVTFSPPEISHKINAKIINMFKSKEWLMTNERYTNAISFIACLPMTWGEGSILDQALIGYAKTTVSSEPTKVLPIQGEWKGTKTPGMLLTARRGQLFYWDSFDNRSGNFNISVCGKPGSGKSFFMQELVISNVSRGGRAFVLDVGRSFERSAKMLGGTFIEFSSGSDLCINPFSKIPVDQVNETDDALAMLKSIVSLMAAPKQGTTDLQDAILDRTIKEVWNQYANQATITDLALNLNTQSELEAGNLSKMLFPYTENGSYGRFFSGNSNVDLSGQLVVFELEELKERKDLQSVIVQIMILQITNQVYLGDRQTPVQVVLDEAWDMLRGKQSALFIETAARRLRKYNGALIVGTQSVNDFYATDGALAAFENSDWLALLEQKSSSITQLKKSKKIDLSPYMEKVLRSIKTIKGKDGYSELMLIGPDGYAVGRFAADRFSQLLYTTDAVEFNAIQNLVKTGLSVGDAIETLSKL